jgi:hypothetical protein
MILLLANGRVRTLEEASPTALATRPPKRV